MLLNLTTVIAPDHPALIWARQQDNANIALGHVGTHLDVYECRHIPLEAFRCPGVLADVRHTDEAGLADVDLDAIPARAFVLFRTGRIERHAYGEPAYFHDHPQLAPELIDALLARRIRFIGIDGPGIRRHAEHEQVDRHCNATVCMSSKIFAASAI